MEEEKPPAPRKRVARSVDGESAPRPRAGSRKVADENATPTKAPRKRASAAGGASTSDAAPKTPRRRASTEGETSKRAAPRKRATTRATAGDATTQPAASNVSEAASMAPPAEAHAAPSTAAPGAAQAGIPRAPAAASAQPATTTPIAARSKAPSADSAHLAASAEASSADATVDTDSTAHAAPAHAASTTAPHDARREHAADKPFVPSFARIAPAAPRARNDVRPADASPRSTRFIEWFCGLLPDRYRNRARNYLVLMRLDRPVGALLLLWPTWWALWFAASDFPPPGALFIFTLGVFVMRSAGCVINDYADHGWLDANVERTAGRPMAAGRVTKKEALQLFAGLLAFAFLLVLFTDRLTIELSFVGAALAAIYPFTKRVTHLAQVVLGAAFGWSIPMAFAAVTNTLPPLCWLLFLANILFSVIYDTQYAMVDRDEDLRVGAKSTAILFGDADRAIVGVLMATFLLAMGLAGTRAALHWPYFFGLAIAAGLFGYQQWLMRDRSREGCFAAFRNNNWAGFALWLGLMFALAIR